ncbi:diaminohydroxyphosphoribosylaminopyrimidine deaminase/5-amino-6-(5-phosphoribosylamino)uracil reductase [Sphingomonas sp. BE270]|jgi:diaminohydroxyphosphoribosylaminopyrimidine deaminase/5-amino-6-(5-phosphoribosylamino)uracil reductase|uniref:bifunctional diaminohydroxyphosphoribosylaminopyrimidine deaminase/5-amino-6-(5-phosphoribosylamino)uracil reductase RibD n=1 Tax=unclassified Sphingomonas TaxID=196159 RepID=UPI0014855467|nr:MULTISPECIES: bifunctional diaminohydroxyphosphoribosylaminopyrimidine deaminase/5-amino-6-(5-phosphoribosylamino)uracil reductase RibD [unclassified Sphingomonas]MDR6848158.1 diaminohydroxyphosphoribosylaminopyrimidine deaminase/5-amino-6-(5-phosphoribosylamino)uracil reductase [Sphingomonas sp. BE137]MDR7258162.1 diaminohydroxyphosphoribosylaminopyrimidine deaminase/5-amino-6-(5-phosphoribosylamino)uracil reductase [Sphingomonas sp. BE270]
MIDDHRWMGAALALGERGRTAPNPNVGCVIVSEGRVVGRGWTQPGGRPHAEAMALAEAGEQARGATVYVTLEPCAHVSPRGPACSDLLQLAGVARVVVAMEDPDVRTNGAGIARLRDAGITAEVGVRADEARRAMAGFLARRLLGRPHVTLKLAVSLDGAMALASGQSVWITGPQARAHAHLERARHEAILVGRGTFEADAPKLDVRLAGLESRSPQRILLSRTETDGWTRIAAPADISTLEAVDHVLVEGGPATAAAFLASDLVDRLLLYRAPILIGGGRTLPDIGLTDLADAHGRWRPIESRSLGSDRLEVYERVREPAPGERG